MIVSPAKLDTQPLKDQYERDGYAVARGLLSSGEVDEIREHFEQLNRAGHGFDDKIADPTDPLARFPRIVHPHRVSELAKNYMLHPIVGQCIEALIGTVPIATQSMYYFKPPGARGQALHQDNLYLLVQPGTCIAAWTAIDATDRDNGCMMVVPGSHRGNLVCPQAADSQESFTKNHTPVPPGLKAVAVPMQAGDTLFFGGTLIHGSSPNRTKDRFRRSFIGHYAAGNLEKISRFYLPLVKLDGTDYQVADNDDGGVCGESWVGATH